MCLYFDQKFFSHSHLMQIKGGSNNVTLLILVLFRLLCFTTSMNMCRHYQSLKHYIRILSPLMRSLSVILCIHMMASFLLFLQSVLLSHAENSSSCVCSAAGCCIGLPRCFKSCSKFTMEVSFIFLFLLQCCLQLLLYGTWNKELVGQNKTPFVTCQYIDLCILGLCDLLSL